MPRLTEQSCTQATTWSFLLHSVAADDALQLHHTPCGSSNGIRRTSNIEATALTIPHSLRLPLPTPLQSEHPEQAKTMAYTNRVEEAFAYPAKHCHPGLLPDCHLFEAMVSRRN